MPFFPILFALLGLSGVLLGYLHFRFYADASTDARLHQRTSWRLEPAKVLGLASFNSVMSGGLIVAGPWLAWSFFISDAPFDLETLCFEVVGALLVYDFGYYFLHRFPFHEWKVLHKIHTLHHTVKYPTAVESLYAHPLENVLGISMFFVAVRVAGPVHPVSFLVLAAVYSWLNIIIHCGLTAKRRPWLAPLAYMAAKHDRHHKSMKAGNYASITPLPDWLFGTLQD